MQQDILGQKQTIWGKKVAKKLQISLPYLCLKYDTTHGKSISTA